MTGMKTKMEYGDHPKSQIQHTGDHGNLRYAHMFWKLPRKTVVLLHCWNHIDGYFFLLSRKSRILIIKENGRSLGLIILVKHIVDNDLLDFKFQYLWAIITCGGTSNFCFPLLFLLVRIWRWSWSLCSEAHQVCWHWGLAGEVIFSFASLMHCTFFSIANILWFLFWHYGCRWKQVLFMTTFWFVMILTMQRK